MSMSENAIHWKDIKLIVISISNMNEETKLVLTPEMIRAEFIESHINPSTATNDKQE